VRGLVPGNEILDLGQPSQAVPRCSGGGASVFAAQLLLAAALAARSSSFLNHSSLLMVCGANYAAGFQ
jgi:hypothetical protein